MPCRVGRAHLTGIVMKLRAGWVGDLLAWCSGTGCNDCPNGDCCGHHSFRTHHAALNFADHGSLKRTFTTRPPDTTTKALHPSGLRRQGGGWRDSTRTLVTWLATSQLHLSPHTWRRQSRPERISSSLHSVSARAILRRVRLAASSGAPSFFVVEIVVCFVR